MFPSKHLSKQYLFKTWPWPSWDGLWAFVGFGLLGLGLYLLQRLTRKALNVKANDLVLHYKKPPLVDSHHHGYGSLHENDGDASFFYVPLHDLLGLGLGLWAWASSLFYVFF